MADMWGPFPVNERDVSKLRGLSISTAYGLEGLRNYEELEGKQKLFLTRFEAALETLQEPRHAKGTCINLQGRDSTPLIEYVAEDEEQREELLQQYETAAEVAEQLYKDPDQVGEQAYDEALEAAENAYTFIHERKEELDTGHFF